MGKGGKAANDTKPIKRNCIMQSGERAVFSPRFLLLLHRTGWEFTCGWCWQHNPLGHQVSAKYRRRIVSWFCPMRRRSLRLLSPDLCPNSDGDTGTFFRVKNYHREFFARKPEAWTWKVLSSELSSSRDFAGEAALRRIVYGRIWKQAHRILSYWRNLVLFPFFSSTTFEILVVCFHYAPCSLSY